MAMIEQSVSTVIHRPAADVFAAVTDITRMGEWSPECTGGRWVAPATGPAVGATFEGDNVARLGPVTLKRWSTTSEVTECTTGRAFEFIAEGMTTWRYELAEHDGATTLTESFRHAPYTGFQRFLYGMVMRRSQAMVTGMERTLARMKTALEA